MTTEYQVVHSNATFQEFSEEVEALLKKGWVCQGGVAHTPEQVSSRGDYFIITQALVRETSFVTKLEYMLVSAQEVIDFAACVNGRIAEGWEPLGGAFMYQPPYSSSIPQLSQTLTRRVKVV